MDGNDAYRHSKWLTFMERRLQMAKKLLNPDDSVLIVTIDEKEVHRLALLLEQTFPGARIQMVSSVVNRTGSVRSDQFGRADEYLFIVQIGAAKPAALRLPAEWYIAPENADKKKKLTWDQLARSGSNSQRENSPGCFYPIFAYNTDEGPKFHSVGDAVPRGESRETVTAPEGCVAIWPIRSDGSEGRYQQTPQNLRRLIEQGYVKLGRWRGEGTAVSYVARGNRKRVEDGVYTIIVHAQDGSIITGDGDGVPFIPSTQWNIASHDATYSGTNVIYKLLGEKRFDYPKSLYAVEDALRFFVKDKPDATVLDFFAGSGTTAHAVMRLNQEDGGRRRSISVTNNEVSADEAKALTKRGLRPGDSEWDELGIAQHVTYPRVKAAITGKTAKSNYTTPIKGKYSYNREGDMSAGIAANAALFRLTYENPTLVEYDMAFDRIAPLLWLRAGQRGRVIDSGAVAGGWAVEGAYGVLTDPARAREFIAAVRRERVPLVYVVTDSDSLYRSVAAKVPRGTETVRLYESYLVNFRINDAVVE